MEVRFREKIGNRIKLENEFLKDLNIFVEDCVETDFWEKLEGWFDLILAITETEKVFDCSLDKISKEEFNMWLEEFVSKLTDLQIKNGIKSLRRFNAYF
jgi:hypothetical protein